MNKRTTMLVVVAAGSIAAISFAGGKSVGSKMARLSDYESSYIQFRDAKSTNDDINAQIEAQFKANKSVPVMMTSTNGHIFILFKRPVH